MTTTTSCRCVHVLRASALQRGVKTVAQTGGNLYHFNQSLGDAVKKQAQSQNYVANDDSVDNVHRNEVK